MQRSNSLGPQLPKPLPERDIRSLVAMLDYLVSEIAKIDATSAHCLMLARESLLDAAADALVKPH